MSTTIDDLAARLARLEERQGLATKADLKDVEVNIRRDIASLATGIGTDLRAIRQDMEGIHADMAAMRGDLTEIKRLLARGVFRWPWERRS
jgi:hypothetical protein